MVHPNGYAPPQYLTPSYISSDSTLIIHQIFCPNNPFSFGMIKAELLSKTTCKCKCVNSEMQKSFEEINNEIVSSEDTDLLIQRTVNFLFSEQTSQSNTKEEKWTTKRSRRKHRNKIPQNKKKTNEKVETVKVILTKPLTHTYRYHNHLEACQPWQASPHAYLDVRYTPEKILPKP